MIHLVWGPASAGMTVLSTVPVLGGSASNPPRNVGTARVPTYPTQRHIRSAGLLTYQPDCTGNPTRDG